MNSIYITLNDYFHQSRALSEGEIEEINMNRPNTSIPYINITHPDSDDVYAEENRTPTMLGWEQKVIRRKSLPPNLLLTAPLRCGFK